MMLAFGAASSAIDSLLGLISQKTQGRGSAQDHPNLFAFQADAATNSGGTSSPPAAGGGAQMSPETLSALLAAQSGAGLEPSSRMRSGSLKEWFVKVDTDGDGRISKSELKALGNGSNTQQADDIFGKLDKDGDGSVSIDELASVRGARGHHFGHHSKAAGTEDETRDPLLQALDGSSSSTVTNSDGSTTTSLKYADGSSVTLTKPATSTASSHATSSYNFLEQLIQRQANALAAQSSSSLSMSV
jgi:hypothetical protein